MVANMLPSNISVKDIAVPLGNWGVIVQYTITIHNSGGAKRLKYRLSCDSNIVINSPNGYILKRRSPDYDEFDLGRINAGSTTVITFSICMPTADGGEFYNQFVVE